MLVDTALFVKRAARSGWYILLEFRSLSVVRPGLPSGRNGLASGAESSSQPCQYQHHPSYTISLKN